MRRRMMVVLGLALVLGSAVGRGDVMMRIHRGTHVDTRPLTDIDSLTFYDAGIPGFVAVPAGVFTMGDGVAYCGWDEHEVTLTRSFYLGQHEVTNQEYLEAVQWAFDHGYVTATTTSVQDNLDGSTQELLDLDATYSEIAFSGGVFSLRDAGHGINPDHPVMEVTWYGAAAYCDWLSLQAGLPRAYNHSTWQCNGGDPYGAQGYRLPTDAEWEYAAQYDDERIYPWGNEAPDCSRANFYDYGGSGYCVGWTSAVGIYPDAPAALGLSDMAGNVFEWCNDWHVCDLGTNPVTDPPGPASGSRRVLRGGSWDDDYGGHLRCANRNNNNPNVSFDNLGFRASRTITPETLPVSMVEVPAGVFTMGDGYSYCGEDEHEVTLTRSFYLGQHEVTNQEYLEAVQWAYDHGYVTATTTSVLDNLDGSTQELLDLDAEWGEIAFSGGVFSLRESPSSDAQGAYPEGYDSSNHPVKAVNWYGAAAYCDWLSLQAGLARAYNHSTWQCNGGDPYGAQGYRLPTDAEWEYAAQYDDERIYPWGDEAPDCSRANFYDFYGIHDYCVGWTSPVGSYPDAPVALGLSDMTGNVYEWCNDWWVCELGTSPVTDPPGPAGGSYRVLRGGCWQNLFDGYLLCAGRDGDDPGGACNCLGFRAARTITPETLPVSMVEVPAGVFTMGDGYSYCGEDEHEVTLTRSFYLGQHEVTNQEYLEAVQWAYDHGYVTATTTSVLDNLDGSTQELLNLDGYGEIAFSGGVFSLQESPSSNAQDAYPEGYDPAEHPVKEVTWYGAVRYCDWLSLQAGLPRAYQHNGDWACNGGDPYGAQGYRLPTDAEWEYAAQLDDERIYPWGDEEPDCSRANFYDYFGIGDPCVWWTSPVGSYPPAPASWGLFDMAGNVFEWCNDWFECDLGTSPVTDPPGPASGSARVVRGGAWMETGSYLRCANRINGSPNSSYEFFGFRAAMTVSSSDTEDPTEGSARISKSGLFQNRPNPFTPVTKIGFELAQAGRVELAIYSVEGRLIRTLINEDRQAGSHEAIWDGCDAEGKKVASGVYFYKLAAPGIAESRRMILLP